MQPPSGGCGQDKLLCLLYLSFFLPSSLPPPRTIVSSRHLFQELNTLLAHLGAPNYRRARSLMPTTTSATSPRGAALISSQLEEFLDSMAGECDEKTLRSIKAKDIFYRGGSSRAGNPVYYWIARKFR